MKIMRIAIAFFFCALRILTGAPEANAINRVSVASGDWFTSATWSPSGTPAPSDNITIASGHTITVSTNQTVAQLTINSGGTLTWSTAATLYLTGNLTVNGKVDMNGGNISLTVSGRQFILGNNAEFIWNPGNNTSAGATLFANGVESFAPTSTLVIRKWYSYSSPLASQITGNFGNLELNSFNGNTISEWNQNNGFETHKITGTLTIDQGWITLDKSGSIGNTSIGSIQLKNVNSTFYAHNGSHPFAFTLTTGSVTNNGGTFFGINDGNGNINLHVTGNFKNYGNVKIIHNSGVANVANGNATFVVDSTFLQTGGDTRIIYNVSTTNSGLFSASFRNLTLNGGIFMGQTGCRTTGGLCTMSVLQNMTLNFQNSTDKFRVSSISSIGASVNRVLVSLTIGGNLSISGVLNAEFTSSASAGTETVAVDGNTSILGCNVSFNYGAPLASHSNSFHVTGNVTVTGGIIFLSRNSGTADIMIGGNFGISSGQVTAKGGDSTMTMKISGSYSQTGGQFYIHNNSTNPSTKSCTVSVLGNFTQISGILSFDSYPLNGSAQHSLVIEGSNFTAAGNGSMTHSGAGTSNSFGLLEFKHNGTLLYYRNSFNSVLTQVKQLVSRQCTVKVMNGNFLVASYPSVIPDLARVSSAGVLDLGLSQLISNGTFSHSAIQADSNSTLITGRPQGFYDGGTGGCIGNGVSFSLHAFSIVEYNGSTNQALTGNIGGIPPAQNQYGILRINLQNPALKAVMSEAVIVRTKLQLTNGEVSLAGNTLTLNSGTPSSLTRTNGYLNGELAGQAPGTFVWKNVYKGLHEFPFGTSTSAYLPIRLFVMAGSMTDIVANTYSTPSQDNQPYPSVNGSALNFSGLSNSYPNSNLIDRWWFLDAPGIVAGLTVAYNGNENTLDAGFQNGQVGVISWMGSGWVGQASAGSGVTSGIGTVSVEVMTDFSAFTIGRQDGLKKINSFRSFTAEQVGEEVAIKWSTSLEYNSQYFTIERSTDGENFETIATENASGISLTYLNYSGIDPHPVPGKNYYRIKLHYANGSITFSEVRELEVASPQQPAITIDAFGPNPFENRFEMTYSLNKPGMVVKEIASSNGQIVFYSKSGEEEGKHTFEYNEGQGLLPGVYFIKLSSAENSVTWKIIRK